MKQILLGQLGSNGDCLYATTIARQIKNDYPNCHLTWAISSLCRKVIENNPDVDDVWEVPVADWGDLNDAWFVFEKEAWASVAAGCFDHAFMTQICPNYFGNYDGTVRPSIFRNYPGPITVPVETVIELSDKEVHRVDQWVNNNQINGFANVVLVECSSKSGQSSMTPKIAELMASKVIAAQPHTCIILSTHEEISTSHPNIIHGGSLSMRETARLTHYVDLFVGCGSGLTVVATSAAAKCDLPNIQVLNGSTSVYASFKHDFEYFKKNTDCFLETTNASASHIAAIVKATIGDGFEAAKKRYAEDIPVDFSWYLKLVEQMLLRQRRYIDAGSSLLVTAERYGWNPALRDFGKALVLPFLEFDERAPFPRGRREIKRIMATLSE